MRVAERRRPAEAPSSGKRSAVAAEVKGGWDRSPWERRNLSAGSRPALSVLLAVPGAGWGLPASAQGRLSQGRGSPPAAEGPVAGRRSSSAGLAGGRAALTALRGEGRGL